MTQRNKIKEWLLKHGSITNVEAVSQLYCLRASERIRELQAQGMQISGAWDDKSHKVYRYTLLERPKKTVYELVERDGMQVRVPRLVEV